MSLSAIVEMGEMKRFHCNLRTVLRGILELDILEVLYSFVYKLSLILQN